MIKFLSKRSENSLVEVKKGDSILEKISGGRGRRSKGSRSKRPMAN